MQWLRLAFWMLYNPLAWAYDRISRIVSLGQWREWQRTGLLELCGERVLELAFGTGDILLDLHAARYRAVGLDLSPSMVRIAQRKLERHRITVPLVRGRAERMPFADASFDSVLSTFPAEFVVALDTLGEVARVLRPGGRAVIVAMAQIVPDTLWEWLLERLYRITGQCAPLPDLEPLLAPLGLCYRTAWYPVKRTSVLLVLLEKQVDADRTLGYTPEPEMR